MEKMARVLPLNPTFIPPTYGVLKSLLENPLKLPLHHEDAFCKEKDKEKKLEDDNTATSVPQSAFLGPTLWDKTLPYDGDTFQLEYMDLEEFLSENGIPPTQSSHELTSHQPSLQPPPVTSPSVIDLSSRASTSVLPGLVPQNCMHSPLRPDMKIDAIQQVVGNYDPGVYELRTSCTVCTVLCLPRTYANPPVLAQTLFYIWMYWQETACDRPGHGVPWKGVSLAILPHVDRLVPAENTIVYSLSL